MSEAESAPLIESGQGEAAPAEVPEATIVGDGTVEFQMPTGEESQKAAAEEQKENLLAGKYQNVSDLEQAYLEAQKKISQQGQQNPPQQVQDTPDPQGDPDLKIQHGPFQGSVGKSWTLLV